MTASYDNAHHASVVTLEARDERLVLPANQIVPGVWTSDPSGDPVFLDR